VRVIGSLDKQGYTITLENVCPRVCLAVPPPPPPPTAEVFGEVLHSKLLSSSVERGV